jgi:hypothetical protein
MMHIPIDSAVSTASEDGAETAARNGILAMNALATIS